MSGIAEQMDVIQSLNDLQLTVDTAGPMEVSEPIAIGQFATTNRATINLGLDALRYLDEWVSHATSHCYDTNQIVDGMQSKFTPNRKLEFILQWIQQTSASRSTLASQGVEFVCWENVVRRIALTPFFEDVGWSFVVAKLKGVHFFDDTEETSDESAEELVTRFSHYVTNDSPFIDRPRREVEHEGPPRPQNLTEQCTVTQRSIDGIGLLYGSNTDCQGEDGRSVQLQTKWYGSEVDLPQLTEWWMRAYLNGFARTVVGSVDSEGFVVEMMSMETNDMLKDKQQSSESSAISFLSAVLHEVKKRLENTKEMEQFAVEYCSRAKTVSIRKLDKTQRIKLLPDYFIHQFR